MKIGDRIIITAEGACKDKKGIVKGIPKMIAPGESWCELEIDGEIFLAPPETFKRELDTTNRSVVACTVDGKISILRTPIGPISKADAINLAAWLVALSTDDAYDDFIPLLDAIRET